MTLRPDELEDEARRQTGLDDFGDGGHREGLERLIASMNDEADLTEVGEMVQQVRLVMLLSSRLRIEDTYRDHPEIEQEQVGGPVFVIGLPRTGTTALSQLVAADPQFRSLRLWESSSPCPPPEAATQHTDPRIAETEAGLAMMHEMYPLMASMHHEEATTPTECQDLMGMTFRTVHFDGMARVPSYMDWVTECDMRVTYEYHRRVLRLLQWHCPPRLWHLKTPVHMFALDALLESYPDAKFLWSHRDPAAVLGSVCSLIHYIRGWSSDRDDARGARGRAAGPLGPRRVPRPWTSGSAWATTVSPTWPSPICSATPSRRWPRPTSRSGWSSPTPPRRPSGAGPAGTSRAPTGAIPTSCPISVSTADQVRERFASLPGDLRCRRLRTLTRHNEEADQRGSWTG